MIKNVLSDIGGIGIYGVISICLFFTVFTGAIIWSMLLKKSDLDSRGALPLEDGVRSSPAAAMPERREGFKNSTTPKALNVSAPGTGALRNIVQSNPL